MKVLHMLYLLLIELNFNVKDYIYSKSVRIQFQKLVYLLKVAGLDFGYRYNLYINGPYSPSLATDGYKLYEEHGDFQSNLSVKLSDRGVEIVDKVKLMLMDRLDDIEWLELLSTMIFLFQETYSGDVAKKACIEKRFKELKPHLASRNEDLQKAWTVIEQLKDNVDAGI